MSTSRVYCTQKLVTWGASQAFYSEVKINLILPQTARNSANIDKSYESHHYARRSFSLTKKEILQHDVSKT